MTLWARLWLLGKQVGTGQDRAHKTFKKWVSAALKDAASARKDTVKLKFH